MSNLSHVEGALVNARLAKGTKRQIRSTSHSLPGGFSFPIGDLESGSPVVRWFGGSVVRIGGNPMSPQ